MDLCNRILYFNFCNGYLSHWRRVQLAIIHKDTMNTRSTVPGQIVIRVLSTNLVLKLMRLRAPILLEEASVKSLLCSNITLHMRYRRRNIGKDKVTSYGTHLDPISPPLFASFVVHKK